MYFKTNIIHKEHIQMIKLIITSFAIAMISLPLKAQDAAEGPFKADAEAGLVSSNGNTRSESYLTKGNLSYELDAYLVKVLGTYLRNKSRDNATNAITENEKWDIGLRLEREVSDRLSVYLGQNMESDKLAGIDRRYNSDAGLKYMIAKAEGYYTFAEAGYRYTTEEYLDGTDENFNFLRAYLETEKKWTPTFSSKMWVEYLPNLDKSEDYNVNAEASVNAALDSRFSIKTAYLVKYDNMPAALHKTDSLFSTSLIAKF